MTAKLVLHWSLDHTTADDKILDDSDAHLNATVQGTVQNPADERFGSCLKLGAGQGPVLLADTPLTRLATYTIETWVKPDAATAETGLLGKKGGGIRLALLADGRIEHRHGVAGGATATVTSGANAVAFGQWRHVAITQDGQRARIFVNGAQVAEGPSETVPVADDKPFAVFGTGLLAHVRVYDDALSETEIRRDMASDESSLTAFVRTHPLGFRLGGEDGQPVLFIDDSPTGQPMTLQITNSSRDDVELVPSSGTVSAQEHHFALRLRPGTLARTPAPSTTTPGWTLRRDGDTLYLLTSKAAKLPPGGSIAVRIDGMSADGAGGGRGTRVELDYRRLRYVGETQELSGTRLQYLEIANHRGRRDLPLDVSFVGGARVLSDGVTGSALRVQIANISRDAALQLQAGDPATAFVVSFEVQLSGETRRSALIAEGAVAGATLGVAASSGISASWQISRDELGQRLQWTISPKADASLAAGGRIELLLDGIYAPASLGNAPVIVEYRNIPGYQDGFVTILAEKTPLLYTAQRVGIGTASPQGRLHLLNEDPAGDALILGPPTGTHLRVGYDADRTWIKGNGTKPLALNPTGGNVVIGGTKAEGRLHVLNTQQTASGDTLVLGPTDQSHLRLGYHKDYTWVQGRGASSLLTLNPDGGNVAIGTTTAATTTGTNRLTVEANENHLVLHRSSNAAGKVLFLELYQEYCPGEVRPSIRFHHASQYWHRIEAGYGGFSFRTGNLPDDSLVGIQASSLQLGSVTIGENELRILRQLASGQLEFDLYNVYQGEYAYAADYNPYDGDRRNIWTWRPKGRVNQGRWRLHYPS
ncbi:LamG domain-containing protein [Spirillospora sp. NPDC049652]